MKRVFTTILALCMAMSILPTAAFAANNDGLTQSEAETAVAELNAKAGSDFYYALVERYDDSEIEYRTEVRWWMAEGGHTDETLEKEVQAMYDAGFRGVELCQLNETLIDATVYGYGSEQWNHDFHVVLNKTLDLGMTVGITSGTNWNTTNVPGLVPDSQAAMQGVFAVSQPVAGRATIGGPVPNEVLIKGSFGAQDTMQAVNDVNTFIGAYAFKVLNADSDPVQLEPDNYIDLTKLVTENAEGKECLDWTAPGGSDYYVFYYWQQGTAQKSSPSVIPSYCVNYFDIRGFDAFKEYFSANVLNDPELNKKIRNGDVQLFMDSLEISVGNCITYWSENFAKEFQTRKGYDIRPYLFMSMGLPPESELARFTPAPPIFGDYNVANTELGQKIFNDLRDVQTELYMENLMVPMEEWLNEYNISLRAQISYGRYMEISEPILTVDYPEAENLNQRNQVDIYRLWSGGSKLQNKVLSSETGALGGMGYSFDHQTHLQEAYSLYAAGFSRINWHIWTSSWAPESVTYLQWPGFQSWPFGPFFNPNFNVFGTREPGYDAYSEFNQHLGRVQKLLREGVARSDVGMLYTKYGQLIAAQTLPEDDMWMQRHDYMLFPSTELQENGYTYDYFSPEFLNADEVYYNAETGTLELAGYKALVLWQDWLTVEGAQDVLDLAKQGLKIVIVDGAAKQTPYNDGKEEELNTIIAQLKDLNSVKAAATADDVMEALLALGVEPYAAFEQESLQLLTQVRQDENNHMYLYVYNYCDGSLHDGDDPDHGTHAKTEVAMDGTFIPYRIDAWTGEVVQLAEYRHEDGKTIITVDLDYGNIALYAFEATSGEDAHAVSSNAASIYAADDGTIVLRAAESGTYRTKMNDGATYTSSVKVPAAYDITGWNLTVEAWSASEEKLARTDTFVDSKGNRSVEYTYDTIKTNTAIQLDKLTTWDKIPEIGQSASGKGYYSASFNWDGSADGAYLDFGDVVNGMRVYINEVKTDDLNTNIPKLDISDYLVSGTNTIKLEYDSNLANELLETGILKEGITSWAGYNIAYRSYGPTQAVIVPYVVAKVAAGEKDCPSYAQSDVSGSAWYHSAVDAAISKGIMNGTSATKFSPGVAATRGTIVTVLYRLENSPAVPESATFTDVAAGDYYADAVAWAAANGIAKGASAMAFAPNQTITREQMAVMLYGYAQHKGRDVTARGDLGQYTDAGEISGYALEALQWANAVGLIKGTSGTALKPQSITTRAEVAALLVRFFNM